MEKVKNNKKVKYRGAERRTDRGQNRRQQKPSLYLRDRKPGFLEVRRNAESWKTGTPAKSAGGCIDGIKLMILAQQVVRRTAIRAIHCKGL